MLGCCMFVLPGVLQSSIVGCLTGLFVLLHKKKGRGRAVDADPGNYILNIICVTFNAAVRCCVSTDVQQFRVKDWHAQEKRKTRGSTY